MSHLVLPPLAHAGEGATWQALLTMLALGVTVVFVLAVLGRVRTRQGDDLVLPLAAVAIIASLAPAGAALLSDWVGWSFPIGVTLLVALLVATFSPLELGFTQPLTYAAVAVAAVGALVLWQPIVRAWHPAPETLPLSDDGELAIASPEDGATVADRFELTVEVTGATVGPSDLDPSQQPTDPEHLGQLVVYVDDRVRQLVPQEPCTVAAPCTTLSYQMSLSEPGQHEITVEFRRADGIPLSPFIADSVTVTAGS